MDGLRRGDCAFIDDAIAFLETDPFFFRSGYVKRRLVLYLKRHELSRDQVRRLHDILVAAVRRPWRQEFRGYCNLARRITDESLRGRLRALCADADDGIAQRARWMAAAAGA